MKYELIKGSIILFIFSNLFNFINYLFQFLMARFLDVASYGVFVTLIAFINYFYIPGNAITTTISRYTSKFFNENGKIKDLLIRSLKKGIKYSFIAYFLFIPIAIFSTYFLKIPLILFLLIGLLLFASFILPVVKGGLQGKKRFQKLGLVSVVEGVTKLVVAVVLVLIIKNVYGPTIAIIISVLVSFFSGMFFLRDIFKEKRKYAEVKGIFSYNQNTFILFLSLALIFGIDVILARRFFAPEIAGQYAVASMMAKIIFFGSSSIGQSMFPITSLKKDKEKRKIFIESLLITISITPAIAPMISSFSV